MSASHRGLREVHARCCATAGRSPGNGAGMLYLGNLSPASVVQRGFHGKGVLGGCAWWVCSVTWGYRSPGTDLEMGVRSLESTDLTPISTSDKARDLIRERYSAYISAGADYDSKWNPSVGDNFSSPEEILYDTRYVPKNLSNGGPMLHRTCMSRQHTCIKIPSTRTIYPQIPRPRRCTYLTQGAEYLRLHQSKANSCAVSNP